MASHGCTSIHFGENQLSPGSIGISPLPTGHPPVLQHRWVRASTGSYPRFTLPMGSSPGFGSYPANASPSPDRSASQTRRSRPYSPTTLCALFRRLAFAAAPRLFPRRRTPPTGGPHGGRDSAHCRLTSRCPLAARAYYYARAASGPVGHDGGTARPARLLTEQGHAARPDAAEIHSPDHSSKGTPSASQPPVRPASKGPTPARPAPAFDCLLVQGFRFSFIPLAGCFSPFPHGTRSLSVAWST